MRRHAPFFVVLSIALLAVGVGCLREAVRPENPRETAVHDRQVPFLGGTVHALAAGPEAGAPVLLLHGQRYDATTWQSLGTLHALAEEGFHVVAVDLPGYGASPASKLPVEAVLSALIPALGIERPVVVAPSMSGRYLFPLLVGEPEAVSALVLVAPAGIRTYRAVVADLRLPVLLVWGEKDDQVPVGESYLLTSRWPQAQRLVMADAGHAAYLDRPEAFNQALVDFLRALSGSGKAGSGKTAPDP